MIWGWSVVGVLGYIIAIVFGCPDGLDQPRPHLFRGATMMGFMLLDPLKILGLSGKFAASALSAGLFDKIP